MRLTIKNLGKIKETTIDFNGITAFYGDVYGTNFVKRALFSVCNPSEQIYSIIVNVCIKRFLDICQRNHLFLDVFSYNQMSLIDEAKQFLNIKSVLDTVPLEDVAEVCCKSIESIFKNTLEPNVYNGIIKHRSFCFSPSFENSDRLISNEEIKNIKFFNYVPPTSEPELKRWLLYIVTHTIYGEMANLSKPTSDSSHGQIKLEYLGEEATIDIIDSEAQFPTVEFSSTYCPMNKVIYIDDLSFLSTGINELDGDYIYTHKYALASLLKEKPAENISNTQLKLVEFLDKLDDNVSIDLEYVLNRWKYRIGNDDNLYNIETLPKKSLIIAVLKRLLMNGSIDEDSVLVFDNLDAYFNAIEQVQFSEFLTVLRNYTGAKIVLDIQSFYVAQAIEVYAEKNGLLGDYSCYDFVAKNPHACVLDENSQNFFNMPDEINIQQFNDSKYITEIYLLKPVEYIKKELEIIRSVTTHSAKD